MYLLKKIYKILKQGRSTSTKHSPTSPGMEDSLMKTSLICHTTEKSLSENRLSAADVHSLLSYRGELNSTTKILNDTVDDDDLLLTDTIIENKLKNFENISQPSTNNIYQSSNITPNSCSESSLNATKLSRSQDCLTSKSSISSSKKRVNIRTDSFLDRSTTATGTITVVQYHRNSPISITTTTTTPNYDDLESGGEPASIYNNSSELIVDQRLQHQHDHNHHSPRNHQQHYRNNSFEKMKSDSYLTMTGTVKRGRKKGQSVDLQLNISREELEQINATALMAVEMHNKKRTAAAACTCTSTTGFHIIILSLLCMPFVTLTTCVYSFYIGTITWYNMFNYFNEEKTYWHKLLLSPLLIVTYPFYILLCTIGLGLYAGMVQISFEFNRWINEICDIEKGFYGWLCGALCLSDCSPYEVVILTDLHMTEPSSSLSVNEQKRGQLSTEELSL